MMLNEALAPATPAPYGRACSTCARAKTKCVTSNGLGSKCERCLRLKKDCKPLPAARKRKITNRPVASNTERLEEKLDGLYKLLQPATPLTSTVDHLAPESSAPTSTQPSPDSLHSHDDNSKNDGLRPQRPTTASDDSYFISGTRSTIYQCPKSSLIGDFEPSSDEAEEYLNIFRPFMATYFPFIIVPDSLTALELRRGRPFLWLCIMSVASKSTVQQNALRKELKIAMGREILVEGKNNIDLLLGILVFVAWGQYHIYDKPIIIQATQLAMALVGNLGLNRAPLKESAQTVLNLDGQGCPTNPFCRSTRTMEERRAVLGCFLLSSVVSAYFQRLDGLRWTPYLDECVAVLTESKEQPTDALLIHLVRLQLMVEKAGQVLGPEEHGDATGSARAPPNFYLNALQSQFQDFKAKIPPDIQNEKFLLFYLYSAELRIHEIAFSKAMGVLNSISLQRLDSLYFCLHATKTWFDLFLSIPSTSYVGFSIPVFTQMAHCIIGLFKLLTLEDPVWDRRLVRDTANLSLILGQIVEKLSQVKAAANLDQGTSDDKDMFSGCARTVTSIKLWWDAKLAAESTDNIALDETPGETYTDFSDDAWLKDILGGGDGQLDLNMQWTGA